MIITNTLQYILLAVLGAGVNLSNIDPSWVKPRVGFEARYYTHNTRPMWNNKPTVYPENWKSYIAVKSEYTILGFMDVFVNFQGFAPTNGWNGAIGGGNWGAVFRFTPNLQARYEHFSCHTFNTANDCGSEDFLGLFIHMGFDHTGYKSFIGRN